MSPEVIAKLLNTLDQINLVAFIILCLTIGSGLTAMVIAMRATWPEMSEELDLTITGTKSTRRFLLGIINFIGLFIITAIGFKVGPLIGLMLLFLLLSFIIIGMVGELSQLGRRVLVLRASSSTPFAQALAGGVCFTFLFFFPVVGQAIFFIMIFRGIGTTVYWFFKRKKLKV